MIVGFCIRLCKKTIGKQMIVKSFASDNWAGIHPNILKALNDANVGHVKAYGDDAYTKQAVELFKQQFGNESDVYFVCSGTAANVLSLSTLLASYQGIICAESAHINVDECGAAEKYTGCKLLTIPTSDGKITVEAIASKLGVVGNQHKVQPKVISITQCTELGTVYTIEEIKKITEFAHANNMYVHMDGARISNAVAHLNTTLAAMTKDAGVDVLCFGGTKDGMMLGEAVIFFNKELSKNFPFIRKQGMQLISKMRFISAQLVALLTDDLWLKNAQHANAMAQLLAKTVNKIPHITVSKAVASNAVFAIVSPTIIPTLQEKYYFYVWNEATSEVRWMTSWDTTPQDIVNFVACIQEASEKFSV